MIKKVITLFIIFSSVPAFGAEIIESQKKNIRHKFSLEADLGRARDGSAKSGHLSGWVGGNTNRLWIRSEEKSYGKYEEKLEAQALYSRNFTQFWDAQIGFSHDFSTDFTSKNVNYLMAAVEGYKQYGFETALELFLSDKGNYSARFRQEMDFLIVNRVIIRPYFETELFAQDVKELEVASGMAEFETGFTTRYEFDSGISPYIALRYHKKTFRTADIARERGDRTDNFVAAVGFKAKF